MDLFSIFSVCQPGSLKFDLTFSNCFDPIFSFEQFNGLATQLILLNITCDRFQVESPTNSDTMIAIFLTPTVILSIESARCPTLDKYRWLSFSSDVRTGVSLRRLTCENRSISLYFLVESTTEETIHLNSSILYEPSTNDMKQMNSAKIFGFTIFVLSALLVSLSLFLILFRFVRK